MSNVLLLSESINDRQIQNLINSWHDKHRDYIKFKYLKSIGNSDSESIAVILIEKLNVGSNK